MLYQLDRWDNQKLSPNLWHHEFRCKCNNHDCDFTLVHSSVLEAFEELRRKTGGQPLVVTSGYRCQVHNKDVGGVPKSRHKRGFAIDIACPPHIDQEEFYRMSSESGFTYCLLYPEENFVHCQISPKKKFDSYLISEA